MRLLLGNVLLPVAAVGAFLLALPASTQAAYTNVHTFVEANGREPVGGLTAYNSRLYGTTARGGLYGGGVLYEVEPSGTNFLVVCDGPRPSTTWAATSAAT